MPTNSSRDRPGPAWKMRSTSCAVCPFGPASSRAAAMRARRSATRLRLNRPQLDAYRRMRRSEAELNAELAATRWHVEALERKVLDLRTALESAADEIERRLKGS
ncbi:hypothetical protein [Sorangium sp. So ce341]|uniref:hypothetical protein n=1 Tax=Sorangium sp. So ce341 TaxID=3133302 RepID=UPI003F607401